MTLALQFPEEQLSAWAKRYDSVAPERDAEAIEVGRFMKEEGYLTRDHLLSLLRWKPSWEAHQIQQNPDVFISEVTCASMASENERFRIRVLTLLSGVDWPAASVILHFGHRDPYPILDAVALWSLGVEEPSRYDFGVWWPYVQKSRQLAEEHGLTMRELDRALRQYSKANRSLR